MDCGSEKRAESKPLGWKPVSTCSNALRLVSSRPAAVSKRSDSAICATTSDERALMHQAASARAATLLQRVEPSRLGALPRRNQSAQQRAEHGNAGDKQQH